MSQGEPLVVLRKGVVIILGSRKRKKAAAASFKCHLCGARFLTKQAYGGHVARGHAKKAA